MQGRPIICGADVWPRATSLYPIRAKDPCHAPGRRSCCDKTRPRSGPFLASKPGSFLASVEVPRRRADSAAHAGPVPLLLPAFPFLPRARSRRECALDLPWSQHGLRLQPHLPRHEALPYSRGKKECPAFGRGLAFPTRRQTRCRPARRAACPDKKAGIWAVMRAIGTVPELPQLAAVAGIACGTVLNFLVCRYLVLRRYRGVL